MPPLTWLGPIPLPQSSPHGRCLAHWTGPPLTAWKVAKYSSGSNPSADGEIPGGSSDRSAASEGPSPASPAPPP